MDGQAGQQFECSDKLWEIQDGKDQFYLKYLGNDFYSICESISGLSLDVNDEDPAEYLSVNKNIQMYTSKNDHSKLLGAFSTS